MAAEDWMDFSDGEVQESENGCTFENVTCTGSTDKALMCSFPDGTKRWVPRGQLDKNPEGGNEIFDKGDVGVLVISEWLATKWEEEGSPEESSASMGRSVCLRETERAILVRLGSGKEEWVPKGQLAGDSEVKADGDVGELRISEWLAGKWKEGGI